MPVRQSIGIGHFRPQMYQYQIGSEKVVSVHHYSILEKTDAKKLSSLFGIPY